MKTVIAMTSESVVKRTTQAQIAATKSFPKTAEMIRKLSEKIKLLKKQALKNYFLRKKADAAKKKPGHKAHASEATLIVSTSMQDRIFDAVAISDEDLAECCEISESAVAVDTASVKKKEAVHLKKEIKSNPKAALRKKQMSSAMRIRENKAIRIQIKKLLEMKKKLQDKAWALYVKKVGDKKKVAAKTDKPSAKKIDKKVAKPKDDSIITDAKMKELGMVKKKMPNGSTMWVGKDADKPSEVKPSAKSPKQKMSPIDLKIRRKIIEKNKFKRALSKLEFENAPSSEIKWARKDVSNALHDISALKAIKAKQ